MSIWNLPGEVCRARLARRNASSTHEYVVSEAEFDAFPRHFVPPTEAEGFETIVHREVLPR